MGTNRVNVEGVGADESDSIFQIVVLDPILEVLIRHHSQGQRADGVLAHIGEFYLQGHSITYFTFSNDVTVTRLPVHQHI